MRTECAKKKMAHTCTEDGKSVNKPNRVSIRYIHTHAVTQTIASVEYTPALVSQSSWLFHSENGR